MSILKEALESLFHYNFKSQEARILRIPGEERLLYIDQNGETTPVVIPPAMRHSTVDSIDDLCAAAKCYAEDKFSFWMSQDKITLVLDDADRRENVTMPLRKSASYEALLQLARTPNVDQEKLISLLRLELRDVAGRSELLQSVRTIKFKMLQEGQNVITHGSESLGRNIENQVTGAGALPEELSIHTNLFDNSGERDNVYMIEMLFDIVPSKQVFKIKPIPKSMDGALDEALERMRAVIIEQIDGARVFFGTP